MEVFYNLLKNQSWGDILAKAKSDQTNLKKNPAEWTNICSILQSEFIKYAINERPVLVSKLCFEYIKLKVAGYITITDENTLAIEELGIKAFEEQESPQLNSFIKICQFSSLAKQTVEIDYSNEKNNSSDTKKRTRHSRTDWLNPLFKSSLETHFYQVLKDVFPSYFIYPNVALSNIFEKDQIFPHLNSEQRKFYFNGVDEVALNVGGFFDFIATGLPEAGQNYQIVLPQVQPIPAGAVYRKYSERSGWGTFFEDVNNQLHSAEGDLGYCPPPGSSQWSSGLTEGYWCVQLTIEDGGLNDNDGLANGTIVDPGGVSVMLTNNTMPVAQADIVTMKRNASLMINALENDSDMDGDILSIGVATATFGSVTITADNQLYYQSKVNFIGLDTITYSLSDGNGGTDSSTVSITVYDNDVPIAIDDSSETNDRTEIVINVLANDSDADNDSLTVVSAIVDEGSVTINENNTLTYTPKDGFNGTATISYTVDDGQGEQAIAQVLVTVNAYQNVTINNKSKGGSMGLMIISLIGVTLYRMRPKRNIGKKYFIHGTAALAVATSMSLAAAEPQWFVTGSVGKSHVSAHPYIPSDFGITGSDLDKSGTSFIIGGGVSYDVYSFTASYEKLGDASASYTGEVLDTALFHQALVNSSPKLVNGISLQGQYTLWQAEGVSASVGLGVLAWALDYTSQLNESVIEIHENDIDLFYNLQVAYTITEHVQVSVKASSYNLSVNDVNNIALGLTYHF